MFICDCNTTADFNGLDFHSDDFNVGNLRNYFYNFFKDFLPPYFIYNDTYKDEEGNGLLVRFLTIFGDEIDQEIIPKLECYLNIIDAQICEDKYLTHISDVLGNPPDIFLNDEMYRNLLSYITSVYKIKGTKRAYELFFSILGFDIDLIEIPPLSDASFYDEGGIYDDGLVYDGDACQPCSYYDITFSPHNQTMVDITPNIMQRLRDAITFNEPINAKLRNLTFAINMVDTLKMNISETSEEEVNPEILYDIGNEYDDDLEYDNN